MKDTKMEKNEPPVKFVYNNEKRDMAAEIVVG
jgi:hypothetical protein